MKKAWSFILIFTLVVSFLPAGLFTITAHAETKTIVLGDCTYTISNGTATLGTATLIDCKPSEDRITSFSVPLWIYDYDYDHGTRQRYYVTAIGPEAFSGCRFTSFGIPEEITNIAPSAFKNCYVEDFGVNNENRFYSSNSYAMKSLLAVYYYGDLLNKDGTELLRSSNPGLDPVIPDGVTSIGSYAFQGTRLKEITIPDCITNIGSWAFSDSSLKMITISARITSIDKCVFLNCTALTDIIIPDSVTAIGDWAFDGCSNLKDIWYQGTASDRQSISIGDGNSSLENATWHYNTCTDEHTYTTDCDISCIRCGWIRNSSVSHSFDDGCDATCNVCGFVRDELEHIYDNDCDAVCGRCQFQRTVGDHTYTLNGGLTCSSCKYSRTPNVPELVSYQSGITLKAYEGLEYSQDGINWQDSNVFPNSQSKTFDQRVKASTIAQESSVSPVMVLCTIYFDGNGGSDVPENICFVLGTEVSLPTAIPTKSGFVFDGWNTTEYTTSFDPGETVSFSDDIVLYAMWDVGCSVCNYDGRIDVHCYCSSPYLQKVYKSICNNCNTYVTYYDRQCNACGSLKKITYEWYCGNCRRNLGDDICDNCDGLGRILQAAPTVISYNHSSVMLLEKAGYEYSSDGITWQTSPIFTGLEPNHRYTFYQRQATTETKPFGTTSSGITVTTDRRSESAIPEPPTLNSRTATSITLNSVEGCEYSNDGINWQWSNTFSGLNCATEYTFYQRYAKTDTAHAGKSSAGATFKTDKGTQSKPSAPSLSSKTHNSVTLYEKYANYEYSRDGVNWQTSNVFNGLEAETNYMFYQRKAETNTYYASEASTALTVKTAEAPTYTIGDIDGDQAVTQDDAVYLLLHTMFGEVFYPLNNAPADIDGSGVVDQDDAVYLLLHTMFGEGFYPLNT